MINIEEICSELQKTDTSISVVMQRIERQQSEISNTMNKAQSNFCSTQEGQQFVQELYASLNKMIEANGSLSSLRSKLTQAISNLKK